MPYINECDRKFIDGHLDLLDRKIITAGDLNYCITRLMILYVQHHGLSYRILNNAVGAAESAKTEFQRRIVGPYEDSKIAENGDVYGPLIQGTDIARRESDPES